MEKLIFDLIDNESYSGIGSTDGMWLLEGFLTEDVGKIEPWKEWIADPANQMECGNYSFLEKQGEKIIIKFVYDEVDNIPNAVTFETNAEQLNYILDRWQEAREKKPKKIIITKDDEGKITVDFED